MTQISVRSSLLAAVRKAQEGALTLPTAPTQFLPIQADIAFAPNFETLANPEIKNDIMPAQTAISGEAPSVTFSHLFKGGGTAGVAPAFGVLLEATFGGIREIPAIASQTYAAQTAAGSTTTVLKMSAANAAKFAKGDTLLIQDDANGHSLVPVTESSGTDVTLGVALETAPATGTDVSPVTTFFPENTDFPVLDLYHYLGGGEDGLETMKDGRTVSVAITANAKENINATYTIEGTEYLLNDDDLYNVVLSSSNADRRLYLAYSTAATGATQTQFNITLDAGTYSPEQLAAEAQSKLQAHSQPGFVTVFSGITVSYDPATRRYTFLPTGTGTNDVKRLAIGVGTGANVTSVRLGRLFGFTTGQTLTTTLVSDSTARGFSYDVGITPQFEDTPPVISRGQTLYLAKTPADNVCLDAPSLSFAINTPKSLLTSVCEPSGNFATLINERTATVSVSSFLQSDDQRFFDSFKQGDKVTLYYGGGQKESGNWKPGESFGIFASEATITSLSLSQIENVWAVDLELTCYSPGDGTGSIFISFC